MIKETLKIWFDVFKTEIIDDLKVILENIYNIDKLGFSIGIIKAGKVFTDIRLSSKYQAQLNRQEWITVIECICTDGFLTQLYIIFKGQNVNLQWIPSNLPEGWRIALS